MYIIQIFVPLLGFGINVFIQILSCRYLKRISLLKSEYLGFVIGLVAMVFLQFYTYYQPRIDFMAVAVLNFIIYACLGYLYFTFLNLGETARRIRILRELYEAADDLSLRELLCSYNAREIVERRINRLTNNGQILYNQEKFYIGKPLVLWMAKAIVMMKLIVLGKGSEYDFSS